MSFLQSFNDPVQSVELSGVNGWQDIVTDRRSGSVTMFYGEGIPGIVWFDRRHSREYEVLEYQWDGPRYQDVMVHDQVSNTETRGKRKGRLAGALIGTILMPGVGTISGAAVGTGRREVSDTRGHTRSHIETQEIPVAAYMRLRDLFTDEHVTISFPCTAGIDARIRNNITLNLDADYGDGMYIDSGEKPREIPESTWGRVVYEDMGREPEYIDVPVNVNKRAEASGSSRSDLLAQLRELKDLLDEGAISESEYEMLKRQLLGGDK